MTRRTLLAGRRGVGLGVVAEAVGPRVEPILAGVFSALRRWCPVVSTSRFAVVVRDDDVRQVLARRDVFSVSRYRAKATAVVGPFPLALDQPDEYEPARAVLDAGVRSHDPEVLARRAEALAATAVARAAGAGGARVDVVGDVVDAVLLPLVAGYLGLGPCDPGELARCSRLLFTEVFFLSSPTLRPAASAMAIDLRDRVADVVAARATAAPSAGDGPDDVLGRLLAAGLPEPVVAMTLVGLFVASFPNSSKTAALMAAELLARPAELGPAEEAAAADAERFAAYAWEAARFRPQAAGVMRRCERDCRLGLATRRPATVRRGATVLALTQSAMMDEAAVEAPRQFRLDRPWADQLHFGHGLHTCLGMRMMRPVLPAVLRPLFALGGLRPAPGAAGRLAWRYPYPSRLVVTVGGPATSGRNR
ncbi:MAG: hypothetical protein ABR511_11635 [Acidimicrobiales bacterium]